MATLAKITLKSGNTRYRAILKRGGRRWNKRLLSDAYREMAVYRWGDGTLKRVH